MFTSCVCLGTIKTTQIFLQKRHSWLM
uniref:Uncharacterized protein n=1 Tax=Arundo donax TaxID=35708 RepID=A0A0A9EZN1_ARUDO